MQRNTTRGVAIAILLSTLCGAAAAHPGHGSTTFFYDGLLHLLELDHLLALLVVIVWAIWVLPERKILWGALAMLAVLVLSWLLLSLGLTAPFMASALATLVVLALATLIAKRKVLLAAFSQTP